MASSKCEPFHQDCMPEF